jgi:hypothetical protein
MPLSIEEQQNQGSKLLVQHFVLFFVPSETESPNGDLPFVMAGKKEKW